MKGTGMAAAEDGDEVVGMVEGEEATEAEEVAIGEGAAVMEEVAGGEGGKICDCHRNLVVEFNLSEALGRFVKASILMYIAPVAKVLSEQAATDACHQK